MNTTKKGITWYAHRIMRMDAQEILWRVRSLLRELLEVGRILTGTVPSVSGPLPKTHFKTTELHPAEYREALSAEQSQELQRYANELLNNRIEFFGRTVDLGDAIDWRRDWNQDLSPPLKLSLQTDYRDARASGDCKEVWEPNRHHQLVVLARAYHAFEDPRYAAKVAHLLEDWLDKNPYGYGMNWRSPLELGIRLINWVWAIDLIQDSGAISAGLSARLHQAAFLQCRDLASKFSQGSSANNHLIGEAAGLFVAASYWFAEQQPQWIADSREILERELVAQQTQSGCTAEQALNYQFFVAQFYLVCGCVDDWTAQQLSPGYWSKLKQYLAFIDRFAGFKHQLPLFGDQDDGYVLNLGYHPHDLADYQGWSAALAGNAEPSHSPSALLLGKRPLAVAATATAGSGTDSATSSTDNLQVLEDAGYAFLQSPEHGVAVLMDAGPLGYGSMAAHGHADALHVAISIDGHPLFVDSGTYDYFTYPEQRNYFRSTRAHNTISVDNSDQSSMSGPFMWNKAAQAGFTHQKTDDLSIEVAGKIYEYCGAEEKCKDVERHLELNLASGDLRITDRVALHSPARITQHFHIHPDVQIKSIGANQFELTVADRVMIFTTPANSASTLVTDGELAQFSPAYHQLRSGACIETLTEPGADGEQVFTLAFSERNPRGAN
ncbi:MAG: alginate lyase family protein [Pseudomonadales bacterium]